MNNITVDRLSPRALYGAIMGSINDHLNKVGVTASTHFEDKEYCRIALWRSANCLTLGVNKKTGQVVVVGAGGRIVREITSCEVAVLLQPERVSDAVEVLFGSEVVESSVKITG